MSNLKVSSINNEAASSGGLVISTTGNVTGTGMDLIVAQSFTAAASVSLLNVFSSTYDNYKVVVSNECSASVYGGVQYGVGGVFSAASYVSYEQYNTSGGLSAATTFANSWLGSTGTITHSEITIFRPFFPAPTSHIATGIYVSGTIVYAGLHSVSTSYTDLRFIASSGTNTGTIRVYGYRN